MSLCDAIYGLAVGDALGVPYEFKPRGSFECTDMVGYGTHNKPAGTWSDDTSMTLATCASIRERGCIDTLDMLNRFRLWKNDGAYTIDGLFDIGITTSKALSNGVGCSGEYDNGNGSLMRIAPLAYTSASDDEVCAVSAITHAHPISTKTCVEFVNLLRNPIVPPPGEDMPPSSGFVRHTFQAALWCLANTSNYRDCVLAAVNMGDDTDTTAAVAGALAGEMYGYDSIPKEWIEILRGKDIIEGCLF